MLPGGGGALRGSSRLTRAAVRSLITPTLPETQPKCAVTEKTAARAAHKFHIRECSNRHCIFLRPSVLLFIFRNHLITALPPLAADCATCQRGIGGGEGENICERGVSGGEEEPCSGAV